MGIVAHSRNRTKNYCGGIVVACLVRPLVPFGGLLVRNGRNGRDSGHRRTERNKNSRARNLCKLSVRADLRHHQLRQAGGRGTGALHRRAHRQRGTRKSMRILSTRAVKIHDTQDWKFTDGDWKLLSPKSKNSRARNFWIGRPSGGVLFLRQR